MKTPNLAEVERIIAAVAAAEIMPRFCKLAASDIVMKGVDDPVTVADKAAEQALIARLTNYLPGSTVVGEESFAADASIVSRLSGAQDVWIIDPIDGTRNFIAGIREFGTMVALMRGGQTVASWIHDPVSGDTLAAEQGGGIWLLGKEKPQKMRLAGQDAATPVVGVIGARLRKLAARPEFAANMAALPALATGSAAAFDYGRLFIGDTVFAGSAAARASFLVYRQSKPWDHLPGLFMLAEAGGYAADLRGNPYNPHDDKQGLLIAPGRESWHQIYQAMKPAIELLLTM